MADQKAPSTPTSAGPINEMEKASASDFKFFATVMKHLPSGLDIDWSEFAKDMGLKDAKVAKVRYGQIRKKLGLVNGPTPAKGEPSKALKPINADNKVTKTPKSAKPRKIKNKLEDSVDIIDNGDDKMKIEPFDGDA